MTELQPRFDWTRNFLLPLLIAAIASCWLLPALGNGMLWQDEAQTALLGRTTLAHGVPIAFDGPNSISQEAGDDYGPHGLWKWHMWLPFYVLAVFFKLFGQTTAIARLPFALFGVATTVLAYHTARALWGDLKSALLTVALILACIPFALLVRQCRYYSPAMFYSLLLFDSYIRMCRGSPRRWVMLVIAGTLLFNSHFVYVATGWAAIGVHAAIWHRKLWRPLLLAAIITGVLCLPPVLWLASLNYRNYSHGVLNSRYTRFQIHTYLIQTLNHIYPYPLLGIPILAAIRAAILKRRIALPLAAMEQWSWPILFFVFTVLVAGPLTPYPFFRYLGPIIAPLLLLAARSIVVAFRIHLIVGLATVLLLGGWWPERAYLYELNHQFVGPTEGIVELLNSRGKPGDVVVTSYEDLALKFYTPFRIVGGLTGEDLTPGIHARWLIVHHQQVSPHETAARDFIAGQLGKYSDYDEVVLNVPDTGFENREDPGQHRYATAVGMPPVIVHERRQGPKK